MNVFLQGMRRSGTTVYFDLFWDDPRFDSFYEPLARMHRPVFGGGSGIRDDDLFAPVKAIREDYVRRMGIADAEELVRGAPIRPEVEFEEALPDAVVGYLAELLRGEKPKAIKFTRMAYRVPILHRLDPNAALLHLVREPRAVVTSHIAGSARRRDYEESDEFFGTRGRGTNWSSHQLAQSLMARTENEDLGPLSDVERVLLVWRESFRRTYTDGNELFGDRYRLLRQEDLVADPEGSINRIFEVLGLPSLPETVAWAKAAMRPSAPPFAPDDERWASAVERLGMVEDLELAGYAFDR